MNIHPTAIVDPEAKVAISASIGPYCIIGPSVEIGDGCTLRSHVVVSGRTLIHRNVDIFPFAVLGSSAQIQGQMDFEGKLDIGPGSVIREHATLNAGSQKGLGITRLGSNCVLMTGAHIGHDCDVGEACVFANHATLGGHVKVGERVWFGGLSAVHQNCEIGELAFIGGGSKVVGDVIPFGITIGNQARLAGLNLIGLKRTAMPRADIHVLRAVYGELALLDRPMRERVDRIEEKFGTNTYARRVLGFLERSRHRPLCLPRQRGRQE